MKRILVPCDFSNPSQAAYQMAIEIASRTNGSVTVLHVMHVPTLYDAGIANDPVVYTPSMFAAIEENARKAFGDMKTAAGNSSVPVDLELAIGGLMECVAETIEQKKTDVVIMGTSGSSGVREILIGSNTEKIVRFSDVPVIAVRTAQKLDTIKTILLPTTCGLDQTKFISKVKELQRFFDAGLQILLVNTARNFRRDAEGLEALKEFANHYQLENYSLHFKSYYTEEEGIIDFAQSNATGMIAMATHARKGLSHLFSGSVTEGVVNHGHVPIWTFKLAN